jgi:hypothetical protein
MEPADYFLRKAGQCALAASAETDELDARLFRAFEGEFLTLAEAAEEIPPAGGTSVRD